MLCWMENGQEVTEITGKHKEFFETGEQRLSAEELENIKRFINDAIDKSLEETANAGDRVYVPGWRTQKDWTGTPLQAIFEKACPGNFEMSAFWYGLITMQVIIDRPETWLAMKTQFAGRTFDQTVYWLKES